MTPREIGAVRTAHGTRLGKLTEQKVPSVMNNLAGKHRAYLSASGCSVICAREPALRAPQNIWLPPGELEIWHLSIAHPDRYPTWDEIADARYHLILDEVTMALLLPPPGEYVNEHPHCFHLWQIDDRRAP